MRTLDTDEDIAEGLEELGRIDPRLQQVISMAGALKVRRSPAGFEGLAQIIVSQQLSAASAAAIWRRVAADFPAISAEAVLASDDAKLRSVGLSGPKIRTLRAAAAAVHDGLDINGLADLPAEEAHSLLTAIKGVGPWTADIYLLFCLGHPDIFPAGDLALRNGVAMALDLPAAPAVAELEDIASAWSPWRGVAALLFWAYYRVRTERRPAEEAAKAVRKAPSSA